MASFSVDFDGDMAAQLTALAGDIKENVLRSAAHAGAVVLYDAARANAPVYVPDGSNRKRVIKPGQLRDSIYRVFSNSASSEELKQYEVSWNHKKAPHGFLIENGHWLVRGKKKSGSQRKIKWVPGTAFMRRAGDQFQEALKAADARAMVRLQEVLADSVQRAEDTDVGSVDD